MPRTFVYIASDHAGLSLKAKIADSLRKQKIEFEDLGPAKAASVDYPDFAQKVARKVLVHKKACGILICGTGIGMAIAANRFAGIRAARCLSSTDARLAREHNNANVLTLGARQLSSAPAQQIVQKFLETKFAGGRHKRRIRKIETKV